MSKLPNAVVIYRNDLKGRLYPWRVYESMEAASADIRGRTMCEGDVYEARTMIPAARIRERNDPMQVGRQVKASVVHFADGGTVIINAETGELIGFMPVDLAQHYMAVPMAQFEAFQKFISTQEKAE